jgi:MFS family permease
VVTIVLGLHLFSLAMCMPAQTEMVERVYRGGHDDADVPLVHTTSTSTPAGRMQMISHLSQSSYFLGLLLSFQAGIEFLVLPVLGSLSDRMSRRPFLFLGLVVWAVCHGLKAAFPVPSVLIAASIVQGLGNTVTVICFSIVADISSQKTVVANFGTLSGVAFGFAFGVGPLVGGLLLPAVGPKGVYACASALEVLVLLIAHRFQFETVQNLGCPKKDLVKRLNPFSVMKVLWKSSGLFLLSAMFFLESLARSAFVLLYLFTENKFGWSHAETGVFMSMNGVGAVLFALALPQLIMWMREKNLFILSLVCSAMAFLAFILCQKPYQLYFVLLLSLPTSLVSPLQRGMATRLVSAANYGALTSALGSLAVLAMAIGPMLNSFLFSFYLKRSLSQEPLGWSIFGVQDFPSTGAPFLLSAMMMVLCIVLALVGYREGVILDAHEFDLCEALHMEETHAILTVQKHSYDTDECQDEEEDSSPEGREFASFRKANYGAVNL